MGPAPRTRLMGGLAAVVALAVLAVASLLAISPPSPKPADAPADQFSAGRAFQQVETIGAQVHVAGSPAAAQVREHLVDRLRELGYDPQVTEGIGQTDALGGPAMAHVHDVVTTIGGSDSTGRLIMMAHYDSVQVSYGANDDGSGVASLLETARALAAGPKLRNDVVLLFTDAEEACLCGSEAFVHSHPLAASGGVVLNFESRGASGPPVMFETSAGNANLVAQYAHAVPYPVATSMAVEVYRILPNDTDFTPFLHSGRFTGLNSANIDGSAIYHSPEDRPEYMDTGTLQAQGANALALARQLGNADLGHLARPGSFDATYFPVLGSLVQYPGYLVWPLALLALLAVAALAVALHRRQGVGWGRMAGGFGMMLVPLVGAAVFAQLFWMLLVAIRPAYGPMLDPWRPGFFRLAVCALVAIVVIGWYALWRRRFGPWTLATGGLGWLAVLGLLMAAVTPGGSYLAALPALAGGVAGLGAVWLRAGWLRLVLAAAAGAVGVLVLAPTVDLFFPALGLATGAAAALIAGMLGLTLIPALEYLHPALPGPGQLDPSPADPSPAGPSPADPSPRARTRRSHSRLAAAAPTLTACVLAVALTVTGLAVDRFDAAHPKPTQLMYALDTTSHRAYWASEQASAHGWLAQYVAAQRDLSAEFPLLHSSVLAGPAPLADLPAPQLTVDSDETNGSQRILTVTIHPQRPVRLVQLTAAGSRVARATVHAGTVDRRMKLPGGDFSLLFHAPPADGVTVTLVLEGTGPVTFRVEDGSDGLAGLPGFTPRPDDVGVQGSHTSELVLVAGSVTI